MPPFLATLGAKLGLAAVLAAILFAWGFDLGYKLADNAWEAQVGRDMQRTIRVVTKQAEATERIVTKYVAVRGATQVVTQTVEKEVIKYVEKEHPPCTLSVRFERVWDGASHLSTPADAPSGADDATDSGLGPATVLRAHAADAEAYYRLRDAYRALVEWATTSYGIQKEGAGP